MVTTSKYRGHKIIFEGGVWLFADTLTPVSSGSTRSCGVCGKSNTPEGYDGCVGFVVGAKNVCCGHGEAEEAYIQYFDEERLSGKAALAKLGL